MNTKLSNEFMQRIADEAAWKELSSELHWSESLLEKYKDKVDWKEISSNSDILWTVSMLQKFKNLIDWDALSSDISEDSLTEECIETFADKWNWSRLSSNSNLKLKAKFIDKYVDKLDWNNLIDRWREELFEGKGIEFYEHYKEYIPARELQQSRLWDAIVEQSKKQIIAEIIA